MTQEDKQRALYAVGVGDTVTRLIARVLPMTLTVTQVTDDQIICGDWVFDRSFGYEIDEDLGWGIEVDGVINTGSMLLPFPSMRDAHEWLRSYPTDV